MWGPNCQGILCMYNAEHTREDLGERSQDSTRRGQGGTDWLSLRHICTPTSLDVRVPGRQSRAAGWGPPYPGPGVPASVRNLRPQPEVTSRGAKAQVSHCQEVARDF